MSPSRTGPLTLRMMVRLVSSMNSTCTWVTLPVLPVRPRTLRTLASLTSWAAPSCTSRKKQKRSTKPNKQTKDSETKRLTKFMLVQQLFTQAHGPRSTLGAAFNSTTPPNGRRQTNAVGRALPASQHAATPTPRTSHSQTTKQETHHCSFRCLKDERGKT